MTLIRRFEKFHVLEREAEKSGWWQDLLRAWAPAGSALQGERQLRIAVRNNYFNFYHKGQSIARVCVGGNNTAKLEVHKKFVYENVQGQGYARLVGSLISCRDGEFEDAGYVSGTGFADWIERSHRPSQNEKRLVEGFVAANQQVIDLEMGVPSWPEQNIDACTPNRKTKFAPRMDLVLLEETESGTPRVVFWEAKTADDGRLRSQSDAKVINQLKLYKNHLSRDNCAEGVNYAEGVKIAYRNACRILMNLHTLTATIEGSALPSLGYLIERVAESDILPELDPLPRLLVIADEKTSISRNAEHHRNKIRKKGFPVLVPRIGEGTNLDRHTLEQARAMEAER